MTITPEQLAEWRKLCGMAFLGTEHLGQLKKVAATLLDALEASRRSESAAWEEAEIQGGIVVTMKTYVAMLEADRVRLEGERDRLLNALRAIRDHDDDHEPGCDCASSIALNALAANADIMLGEGGAK